MSLNNIIIGIDTSCYTTSIAAISLENKIIFNEKIALEVEKNSNGLRQSDAVFKHINNIGFLADKIKEYTKEYKVEAICVSKNPRPIENSYMPVFNVGYNLGKLLSSVLKCKFYETTHQENHIRASLFTNDMKNKDKFMSFHISGGTTELLLAYKSKEHYKTEIIGSTNDINFGQLIDRIGVKLGYNFPCGEYIDKKAMLCDYKIEKGLKTSVKEGIINLSGIENQITELIKEKDEYYICKITLDTITRILAKIIDYACDKYDVYEVVFAGGVSASKYIKENLYKKIKNNKIKVYFTSNEYATDNAVGCAIIGMEKYIIDRKNTLIIEEKIEFEKILKKKSEEIEKLIKNYIPKEEGYQKSIINTMNYSLLVGGKRLRPILTLEACRLFNKDIKDAIPFAVAIEMIHTYSLIHDDLPALDNDSLRRGKPTNHIVYGEDMAILAGDSLLNYAFEVMLSAGIDKENTKNHLLAMNEIAKSSGIYGMIGGQVVDIESEGKKITKETLQYIHLNKTASIIIGCMRAGAIIGGANENELSKITTYAKKIGLAFQIVDDILDIEGDEQKLGKNIGSDIENEKSTYPSILGLETSKEIAKEFIDDAKEKINEFENNDFLLKLADYILKREY